MIPVLPENEVRGQCGAHRVTFSVSVWNMEKSVWKKLINISYIICVVAWRLEGDQDVSEEEMLPVREPALNKQRLQ